MNFLKQSLLNLCNAIRTSSLLLKPESDIQSTTIPHESTDASENGATERTEMNDSGSAKHWHESIHTVPWRIIEVISVLAWITLALVLVYYR